MFLSFKDAEVTIMNDIHIIIGNGSTGKSSLSYFINKRQNLREDKQ